MDLLGEDFSGLQVKSNNYFDVGTSLYTKKKQTFHWLLAMYFYSGFKLFVKM